MPRRDSASDIIDLWLRPHAVCYTEIMKMTDRDIRETRKRFKAAKATLACEGIHLTADEEELFVRMIADGLPPDERLRNIRAYIDKNVLQASDDSE